MRWSWVERTIIGGLGFGGLQCFELLFLVVWCLDDCDFALRLGFDRQLAWFDIADDDFVAGFETGLFEPAALQDDPRMAFVGGDC